jgi:hypothetical protein
MNVDDYKNEQRGGEEFEGERKGFIKRKFWIQKKQKGILNTKVSQDNQKHKACF